MSAYRPLIVLWLASACTDLSVYGPPIGVGLTASVMVQTYECDHAIYNSSCGDVQVRATEARSLDPDTMAVVGIEHGYVRVHGNAQGTALIEIDAASQTISDTIEVYDIEAQSLIGCWPEEFGWPCLPALYFTGSTMDVSLDDTLFFRRDDNLQWDLLSGEPMLWLEPGTTAATFAPVTEYRSELLTGERPGVATLRSSTGARDKIEIVAIDQIASIEPRRRPATSYEDSGDPITRIVLGHNGSVTLDLHPALADGRKIRGETPDPPTAKSDSVQVDAGTATDAPNAIAIRRIGVGHATVTIRWGAATATIAVIDPRLPEE